jgi:hypothetical protein
MKRIETIRLYPTRCQIAALTHALHITRHLYNAALQQRQDAYRLRKISITAKMQYPRWPPKMYHLWPVENVPGVGGRLKMYRR